MLKRVDFEASHKYSSQTVDTPQNAANFRVQDFVRHRESGYSKPRFSSSFCDCGNVVEKSPMKRVFDWMKSSDKLISKNAYTHKLRDESHSNCIKSSPQTRNIKAKTEKLDYISRRLPKTWEEQECVLANMDKIFCSVWLNDTQILMGTKCQNLIILDAVTGKKILLPKALDNLIEFEDPPIQSQCSGIHSLAINPSKTMLAVGAGKPNENIQIYQLPSFEPLCLLKGHQDMVFAVSWIDDYTLVSGSRDKALKTWRINDEMSITKLSNGLSPINVYKSTYSRIEHEQKVRDIVFDKDTTQIFTLSTDGYVKIWDSAKSKVMTSVPLTHTNETVCMSLDAIDHVVSVGSQAHISMIDPRLGKIIHTFESLDEGWGVRSLSIHANLVTVGGGLGRISFYDLRAQRYLHWEKSDLVKDQAFLRSGKGWLNKDQIYQRHFQGIEVSNAVYTLSYDQSYGRLFSAGGPLQLNLKGSYSGLWQ